jgi:hypothetical protein
MYLWEKFKGGRTYFNSQFQRCQQNKVGIEEWSSSQQRNREKDYRKGPKQDIDLRTHLQCPNSSNQALVLNLHYFQ